MFVFKNKTWSRANNAKDYTNIGPYKDDITTQDAWCKHPPCYYKSWLNLGE